MACKWWRKSWRRAQMEISGMSEATFSPTSMYQFIQNLFYCFCVFLAMQGTFQVTLSPVPLRPSSVKRSPRPSWLCWLMQTVLKTNLGSQHARHKCSSLNYFPRSQEQELARWEVYLTPHFQYCIPVLYFQWCFLVVHLYGWIKINHSNWFVGVTFMTRIH